MAKSIIQSFSLDITEASLLAQAEDKAKEQGKSFSKYIVQLMKDDLEKKEIAQQMPILNKDYQTCISEYIPRIYKDNVEQQQLFRFIETCTNERLTELSIQVNNTRKEIEKRRAKPSRFKFGL